MAKITTLDLDRLNDIIMAKITGILSAKDVRTLYDFVSKDWEFNTSWNLVQSSNIHAIKYDIKNKIMYIQFYKSGLDKDGKKKPKKNGERWGLVTEYEYFNVPERVATSLLVAEYTSQSVGRQFYLNVKLNEPYKYKQVPIKTSYVPSTLWFVERADQAKPSRIKLEKMYRNPAHGGSYKAPSFVRILKESQKILLDMRKDATQKGKKKVSIDKEELLEQAIKNVFDL